MTKLDPTIGIFIFDIETGERGEIVGSVPSCQVWQVMMPGQPIAIVGNSEIRKRYSRRKEDCKNFVEQDPYVGGLKNF